MDSNRLRPLESQPRELTKNEGVKSLIVRGKSSKKNYQFNIPANLKLDAKAASELVGEIREFEDPLLIQEQFGLQVGGVPPIWPPSQFGKFL